MKKILWVLLIVLVLTSVAFAGRGNMNVDNRSRGYTRSVVNQEQQEVVGRSKGMGYQNKTQSCDEYVDEDGDGVCDNCDGEGLAPQDGTGNQKGRDSMDRSPRFGQRGGQTQSQRSGRFFSANNTDEDQELPTGTTPQDGSGNQYGRRGK